MASFCLLSSNNFYCSSSSSLCLPVMEYSKHFPLHCTTICYTMHVKTFLTRFLACVLLKLCAFPKKVVQYICGHPDFTPVTNRTTVESARKFILKHFKANSICSQTSSIKDCNTSFGIQFSIIFLGTVTFP